MEDAALRFALTQYGLLSRKQGKALGLTAESFRWLTRTGAWQAVLPGVIRVKGYPDSWEQRLKAACLWAGPACAVSHRSAAAWWQLRGFEPGTVEITTTKNRSPVGSLAIVHRQRAVRGAMAIEKGIPVTNPLLTLMELGSVVVPELVERALDDALLRGRVSLRRLWLILDQYGGSGHRGAGTLRILLKTRDAAYAPPEGELDERFRKLLKSTGLPKPREQYEVRRNGKFLARLDFAYPEYRLAIETDGYVWHAGRLDWQRDPERRHALVAI